MNLSDTSYKFLRALVILIGAAWLILVICWSWIWLQLKPLLATTWDRFRPQTRRGWLVTLISGVMLVVVSYLAVSNTAIIFSIRSPQYARVVVVAPFQYSIVELPTLSQLAKLLERVDRMDNALERTVTFTRNQALDVLARADFALYTAGANYIPSLTSSAATRVAHGAPKSYWKSEKQDQSSPASPWPHGPAMALHHVTAPGYCWPFVGSEGHLGIKLARRLFVEEITIEHVAAELSWNRSSAPRQMHLWGLVDGDPSNMQRVRAWEETSRILNYRKHMAFELGVVPDALQNAFRATGKWIPLASFSYDIAATQSVQTFPVDTDVRGINVDFGTVVLIVSDNWGNTDFTCLYRVRIHGRPCDGSAFENYA